jgi:hypothetical protein
MALTGRLRAVDDCWPRVSLVFLGGLGTILLVVVLTLPFSTHIWRGWWDAYSGDSGVVIDKGSEFRSGPQALAR